MNVLVTVHLVAAVQTLVFAVGMMRKENCCPSSILQVTWVDCVTNMNNDCSLFDEYSQIRRHCLNVIARANAIGVLATTV